MDQRKKHVNAVLMKAREQQLQQQAERTSAGYVPQSTSPTALPNNQPVPAQPVKTEIKPAVRTSVKKPVTKQQAVPISAQ